MKNVLHLLILSIFISCSVSKDIPQINSFRDLQYPYDVSYVTLDDGKEIAYIDEGKGDVILMIHGLGSYAPAWKNNIATLKENYRCIAIDLPGYGKSSKGNYEASMTSFSKVIKSFLDKMNIDKINIMGHSMGGQISIVTALAYPDMIDKLILIAPAGFEQFHEGQKDWLRNVYTADLVKLTPVETIIDNFAWNFYHVPEDAKFMIDDRIAMRDADDFDGYCYIIPESVEGMVDEPVYDFLPDIQQKTLVIFGENDNLIPNRFLNPGTTEKVAKDGAEKIPHSELHMIKKAGHFVQFEQSETVNQLIHEFLK